MIQSMEDEEHTNSLLPKYDYGNEDEETGPWKVSGAWLFRGPGIIAEMIEENPDSEYYEWKKIDVSKEEGKQAVKEQFMADKLEGEPVLDRRYFK